MQDSEQSKFPKLSGAPKRMAVATQPRVAVQGDHKPTPKQRRKREKKQQINLRDLGFRIEEEKAPKPTPKVRRPIQYRAQDITLSPYYRFSLRSSVIQDPNAGLDWDSVGKVTKIVLNEPECPICLEHELVAGMVNRCGHSFCWPCVYKYYLMNQRNVLLCPVCTERLFLKSLAPVSFIKVNYIQEQSQIQLNLMVRPKGTLALTQAGCEVFTQIHDSEPSFLYNRLLIQSDPQQDINYCVESLNKALSASEDSFEREAIQLALNQAQSMDIRRPDCKVSPVNPADGFYYIYQSADGQPCFLHPINIKMLHREFGPFENCPTQIFGTVLEVEDMLITELTQQKMKFFSFLSKGTTVNLVEIDMSRTVSKGTLQEFSGEINKRRNIRRAAKAKEERLLSQIEKRRIQEEQDNLSLLAYFENPTYHPVSKPVVIVKKEDSSSEEETPSKSIWSNLEEVLKNPLPPKPRVPKEEKKNEEDDEGAKLTLFDLIKHQTKK